MVDKIYVDIENIDEKEVSIEITSSFTGKIHFEQKFKLDNMILEIPAQFSK